MRRLFPSELLQIWEHGPEYSLLSKSLLLLATACPPADYNLVAQWSIGTRDGLLIQIREQVFGLRLINNAVCPNCSETVEWEMKTRDLLLQSPQEWVEMPIFSLEISPLLIRYRLPNSVDFMSGVDRQSFQLVRDCIVSVEKKGKPIAVESLSEELLQKLEAQMEKDDPNANLVFNLSCLSCQHQWKAVFDIISYLWKELGEWARQILQEVFILARAMGWSEAEILDMSTKRRQFYLEMLRT